MSLVRRYRHNIAHLTLPLAQRTLPDLFSLPGLSFATPSPVASVQRWSVLCEPVDLAPLVMGVESAWFRPEVSCCGGAGSDPTSPQPRSPNSPQPRSPSSRPTRSRTWGRNRAAEGASSGSRSPTRQGTREAGSPGGGQKRSVLMRTARHFSRRERSRTRGGGGDAAGNGEGAGRGDAAGSAELARSASPSPERCDGAEAAAEGAHASVGFCLEELKSVRRAHDPVVVVPTVAHVVLCVTRCITPGAHHVL